MNIEYPALIKKDKDGRYFVRFKDLPEAITEGETLEEAFFNASEVLTMTLEGRMAEGMKIPKPSRLTKTTHSITPSARVQAALLVKHAKGKKTLAELARSLEASWPVAARLEDPKHWPTLKQLERTALVLGKQLVISFKDQGAQQSSRR